MRDAFGGAFSIKLMLVFLMLYIFFICVALNYAKAFRVKNRIINIIEQREVFDGPAITEGTAQNLIAKALDDMAYSIDRKDVGNALCGTNADFYGDGYSVYGCGTKESQCYYTVCTYVSFNIPIINVKFPIALKGQTRLIQRLG